MNTTIQALQGLYVKLGGSLTDTYANIADGAAVGNYTTIPDMIEACTQKAGSGGGGSSLPAVTAEDNDKVLTVVDGAWDKAEAQGGASRFTVNFAEEKDQPIAVTDDEGNALTISQIVSAIDDGKNVVGKFADSSSGIPVYFNLLMAIEVEGLSVIGFSAIKIENGTGVVVEFAGSNEGEGDSWQKTEVELQAAST